MEERATSFGPEHFGAYLSGRRNFLRFELLLGGTAGDGDGGDPFVRVPGAGRLGSLFLGRLRSNDGALDRTAVLKVLSDGRAAGDGRGAAPDPNPLQVRLFQEEYRALRLFREGDPDPVLRLVPFDLKTGDGVELPRHLPLYFCRRRRLFFTPRCARCAGLLRDCRDDDLLSRFGLQTYAATNARYLHCPTCAAEASSVSPRFHAHDPGPGDLATGVVGDARALVASFGNLARRGPAGIPDFPCAECAHAGICHPADGEGDAHLTLTPFSFHDFHAFLHEFLPLRFDEACDLAGGRASPGAAARLSGGSVRSPAGELLFDRDPSGRSALEVLLVKLGLCKQLCLGVQAVHRRFETPHLALGPAAAWVGACDDAAAAPGLWGLRLRVTPPDAPVRVGRPAAAGAADEGGFRWPEGAPSAYGSPRGPLEAQAGFGYDLYGVGLLLLRALVGNRAQGEDLLVDAARLASTGGAAALPSALADPANLWWEPRPVEAHRVPGHLWARSLDSAAALLRGAFEAEPGDALRRVAGALADLELEVRTALLLNQPGRGLSLREVLAELVHDEPWLAAVEAGGAPGVVSASPTPPGSAAPEPTAGVEDAEATLIVRPGAGGMPRLGPSGGRPAPPAAGPSPEAGLDATLIVRPGGEVKGAAKPAPTVEDSDPEATILRAPRAHGPGGAADR